MKKLHLSLYFALLIALAGYRLPAEQPPSWDVIVYGGTGAGAAAAIEAARHGMHVALLEPGHHIGGMLTGGLSATDLGNERVIGGIAREFFQATAHHYGFSGLERASDWRFEPHVGEQILLQMLADAHVEIHYSEQLRPRDGVEVEKQAIKAISTTDGRIWKATVYIDCSYEGDMMSQAGVRYAVGRESVDQYGESLAGVQAKTPRHQFSFAVSPIDANGHLLAGIDPGPLSPPGSADRKVQAYNFRVILTHDPADLLPFPRPERYDPAQFDLLARYLEKFIQVSGRSPRLADITIPTPIPGNKVDVNNGGPVSTDCIGMSWGYPEASYDERGKIWQQHLDYTKGFFYFLANDPRVPAALQHEVRTWGLPRDEFPDTAHWPFQLYVREGRRMIGSYVMRQSDLQTALTKADAIGMGSYNSDSHNVQRIATSEGRTENEGNMEVPVAPYQIPYRSITPQRHEVTNLLVPVCLSATHVAYSSLRMEPQYMILGQAAGLAASLATKNQAAVQAISVPALQSNLLQEHAILRLSAK